MAEGSDDIASLRLALAEAERTRDKALADAADAEQRRRDERQEELNRLRNLFSVVRVIARRTGDDAASVEEYCGLIDGRLSSFLSVHAAAAGDWWGGVDLALMMADQLLPFHLKEGQRVRFEGQTVKLTSRAAVLVSLAIHELAAAAVLAGRLEDDGKLRVSWSVEGGEHGLRIEWMESGVDRAPGDDGQTSWADWIEQAIEHQLAGSMTVADSVAGRSATLRLPNSAIVQARRTARREKPIPVEDASRGGARASAVPVRQGRS